MVFQGIHQNAVLPDDVGVGIDSEVLQEVVEQHDHHYP